MNDFLTTDLPTIVGYIRLNLENDSEEATALIAEWPDMDQLLSRTVGEYNTVLPLYEGEPEQLRKVLGDYADTYLTWFDGADLPDGYRLIRASATQP